MAGTLKLLEDSERINNSSSRGSRRGRDIFRSKGKAASISTNDTKALLKFDKGDSYNLILESADGLVSESVQAVKSFSDVTYVTTFGQALNQIRLAGIYIPSACSGSKTDLKTFYEQNRAGKHVTLTVTFANITIKGFLVALDMDPFSKQGIEAMKFSLIIMGQPVL